MSLGLALHPIVSCYSKDEKGRCQSANAVLLDIFNFSSYEEIVGKTNEDVFGNDKRARIWTENDKQVMRTHSVLCFNESLLRQGKPRWFRSVKSALIGHSGKVIGIQGMSIPISDTALIPLSKQQNVCLQYLAKGYTHQKIADMMGLKQKTVEHYVHAIKIKLNCTTREHLVIQAIERGLTHFI